VENRISLYHGSGGKVMHTFLQEKIMKKLGNGILEKMDDAAVLNVEQNFKKFALTTDSYVVSPLFFNGGDIGKLAICGTVNDLATSGAKPSYLTMSFILEEGFEYEKLDKIIDSISKTAKEAGVKIVTGDTKVVEKGKGDGIYINTAGVGFIPDGVDISTYNAQPGDSVIINGPIGNHEITLFLERENLNFETEIKTDAAPLNKLVEKILAKTKNIHVIKDPTRGGLASAMVEICEHSNCSITLFEDKIPVDPQVNGVCKLVGFDPVYLANEGKFIFICPEKDEDIVLSEIGESARVIGKVGKKDKPELLYETIAGGLRKLTMMETIQLPRIC
jgi:hydrogenase expression/formation protein HypE